MPAVTPLLPDPLVKKFREGLGQTVGKRFRHDRVVVVVVAVELGAQLIQSKAGRDGKRSDIVNPSG